MTEAPRPPHYYHQSSQPLQECFIASTWLNYEGIRYVDSPSDRLDGTPLAAVLLVPREQNSEMLEYCLFSTVEQ